MRNEGSSLFAVVLWQAFALASFCYSWERRTKRGQDGGEGVGVALRQTFAVQLRSKIPGPPSGLMS